MTDDLLSVVVPVYNVAPYLDRSIQSILNQTYYNIEVILVNDGSTDCSGEICEKYARLDSRIKLIAQENQGAAGARLSGVRLASGQYITFVDPDDYIDFDFYEQLMGCRNDFDVVISQWVRESDSGTRRCYDKFRLGAYETPEDMAFLCRHLINVSLPGGAVNLQPGIAAYLWNKLFKAGLVRQVMEETDVSFPNFNDDRPIIYGVLLRCRSALITEICGYHYWVRESSLAHAPKRDCGEIKSICQFYDLMASVFSEDPRSSDLMPQLQMKLAEGITRGIAHMEFPAEAQLQLKTPVFPFINLLEGKRIALYGAGSIGRSYRRQIQKWDVCQIVLWIDENWEEYARAGLEVESEENLSAANFDCIVIAVTDQVSADSIRQKLISEGIEDRRILWRAPLEL